MSADIGLIGLAVMGENLVINMASNGFTVAVFNRTVSKVDEFIAGPAKGLSVIGTHSFEELVSNLKSPRIVMIMVRAGNPVDDMVNELLKYMSNGDIIVDGGNSNYCDTNRRVDELKKRGINFVGMGISGGEEGALSGASIMPGGSPDAWPYIRTIFQSISAKVDGMPCCDWVGNDGAGHYIKTIHNGHEYACCQAISEAYDIFKNVLNLTNDEISSIFNTWNGGLLNSYLLEISTTILAKRDEKGNYILDYIMDTAGQKGTGKWTAASALEFGVPLTLITQAVFSRFLSTQKSLRITASKIFSESFGSFNGNKDEFINCVHDALYATILTSCAQGFQLIRFAANCHGWTIDYSKIAFTWRGGCIIQAEYLKHVSEAYRRNQNLENLLFDTYFAGEIRRCVPNWRETVAVATRHGVSIPTIGSGLSFYDGLRRAVCPANLIQAQRDYFGAHTYERVDAEPGRFFHTDWAGRGGCLTSASSYNA